MTAPSKLALRCGPLASLERRNRRAADLRPPPVGPLRSALRCADRGEANPDGWTLTIAVRGLIRWWQPATNMNGPSVCTSERVDALRWVVHERHG